MCAPSENAASQLTLHVWQAGMYVCTPVGSGRSVSRLMPMTEVMVLMADTPSHPAASAVRAGWVMSAGGADKAAQGRAAAGVHEVRQSARQDSRLAKRNINRNGRLAGEQGGRAPTCDVWRHLCPHWDG
jgi:hypothetical protein